MALALHPDRHDGCEIKTKQFKEASEAYNILTDIHRRREYDLSNGAVPTGWYNKNRRRAPPSDYRKVYAPHAPPTGKWHDAQKHYDMHYGEGQFREAVKNAYIRAEAAGEFDYTSPLGKGFSFETHDERKARYGKDSIHGINKNPYSWEQQGPPSQQYKYEESYVGEAKTVIKRRENIVHKLHERRQERMERESKVQASSSSTSGHPGQRIYHPFNQGEAACQIM